MKRALISALLVALPVAAAGVDITTCEQTVPVMEVGVLQTNLNCSGNVGITLEHGATLDMNGHSLTMSDPVGGVGVGCTGRTCRITSTAAAGMLIGPSDRGLGAGGQSLRVSNLVVSGFRDGLRGRRIIASLLSVSGSAGYGIFADRARVTDSSFTGCGGAIGVDIKVSAKNVTISDNLVLGIDAGQRITGRNLIVTNNGVVGIDASVGRNNHLGKMVLRDSQVTGHTTDLLTALKPVVRNTPCGTSVRIDRELYTPIGTWSVCAGD